MIIRLELKPKKRYNALHFTIAMARLSRFFIKDQPQHIIQRGNNKDIIFAHEGDYQY